MGGFAPDERIVRESAPVASSGRIDVFQHETTVDPALAGAAERALARMEEILGTKLDEATLGPRVRIYVSASTRISHVWRGYRHPEEPRAVVFLNTRVAEAAVHGTNATYAHELAHLLTWRFHSHSLREGLADYLALQLHPGAGVGPNARGYGSPPAEVAGVADLLGTTTAPPPELATDAAYRRAYYFASYRFVRHLIARAGMSTFLRLYEAPEPEGEYQRLYGASRQALAAAAAN